MTAHAHHPHHDRLVDCYFAERSQQGADPLLSVHLAECGECRARYAALARFMDALRAESDTESDEIFTPERLRAQQVRIARRIEHVGRAARVLSFPHRLAGRHTRVASGHAATRWVSVAAAAGLAIGVALGALYDIQRHATERVQQSETAGRFSVPRPAGFTPVAAGGAVPAGDTRDDVFLSELEMALERPHTRALQPFDALTPHVRPVNDVGR